MSKVSLCKSNRRVMHISAGIPAEYKVGFSAWQAVYIACSQMFVPQIEYTLKKSQRLYDEGRNLLVWMMRKRPVRIRTTNFVFVEVSWKQVSWKFLMGHVTQRVNHGFQGIWRHKLLVKCVAVSFYMWTNVQTILECVKLCKISTNSHTNRNILVVLKMYLVIRQSAVQLPLFTCEDKMTVLYSEELLIFCIPSLIQFGWIKYKKKLSHY